MVIKRGITVFQVATHQRLPVFWEIFGTFGWLFQSFKTP